MTRKDSVRAATSSAKDSVRHAAEVVAPYAGTAKDTAVHYAHEARTRLAPKVVEAAHQARSQYDAHLQPRIEHARGALPPQLDAAATRAAVQTRRAARQAADYAGPRLTQARAAAEPVRDEALSRSTAALAALRGRVSAEEVQKLVERRDRRCRTGRVAKRFVLLGLLAGGAYAAWKWWDKQANPDWLVEPPAPTEVADRAPLSSVDGSATATLDPEVQAKQDREDLAEDTMEERDEQR
ncbi:transcriptional regulator [Streptomyces griseocarneus]|nr:transcriptional regulator [Streptomyces griseocarneus]